MSSSTMKLPDIGAIPSLSTDDRASILDLLFEPCVQLHTLSVAALHENTFGDYGALVEHVRVQLMNLQQSSLESDQEWLVTILAAHPRLGEKKVESAMSKMEQAAMRAQGQQVEGEAEMLKDLNSTYEDKFPGLRYVTFVNGRSRTVIMEDMRKRINSSNIRKEKEDAIHAMCDIAIDRAKKLGAVIKVDTA